jgi:glutamate 5-kinase
MFLENSKCLVIKVGSALLVDEAGQCINQTWLSSLIDDINRFKNKGIKVVIVSSGAIALGKIALKLTGQQLSLDSKQAAAATGQIQLINLYQTLLAEHDVKAAQVLLTLDDTENRQRYVNLRNTLNKLLEMDIIPIINENDSVATAEIRYGDNDRLAARVAQMLAADTLVLLSDVDGLYTDDPRKNSAAALIANVPKLTDDIMAMGKPSRSQHGTGGMATKLSAAKIAVNNGCRMLITSGHAMHPLTHFMQTQKGTWFHAEGTPANAKQRWLEHHMRSEGEIMIDEGAAAALEKGASLLPVGIKKMSGQFCKGSPITIVDLETKVLAKGLSNYPSDDLQKIIGKKSYEINAILLYEGCSEAVHRDNLVLTSEK